MRASRVRIGRMPGRGWRERVWRLLVGAFLVGVVVTPLARPGEGDAVGAVLLGLVGLAMVAMVSLDSWVDPGRGLVGRRSLWCLRWGVRLADADHLVLRSNHRGVVLLQLRAPGRRDSVWVPVAAVDQRGARAQPARALRLLAGEVRRWAPDRHHGVAEDLDAQAAHLEAGGSIAGSPLVRQHCRDPVLP